MSKCKNTLLLPRSSRSPQPLTILSLAFTKAPIRPLHRPPAHPQLRLSCLLAPQPGSRGESPAPSCSQKAWGLVHAPASPSGRPWGSHVWCLMCSPQSAPALPAAQESSEMIWHCGAPLFAGYRGESVRVPLQRARGLSAHCRERSRDSSKDAKQRQKPEPHAQEDR